MDVAAADDPAVGLVELMATRSAVEEEIKALVAELETPGADGAAAPGVDAPLVDSEGFPRADVDVYRARHARHRLACLRTDFKELTKQIEHLLQDLHARQRAGARDQEQKVESEGVGGAAEKEKEERGEEGDWRPAWYKPFALVDEVHAGSPAEEAGLRLGDEILSFGNCTRESMETSEALKPLVQEVQRNLGQEVRVVVVRNCARTLVKLVPKPWSGKGSLGCHLKPSDGSVTEWACVVSTGMT